LSPKEVKDLVAYIQQRLLDLSRDRGETYEYKLTRYGIERLLYRLSKSEFRDQFILKGAMLFSVWLDRPHRPTKDIDMLGYGEFSRERLQKIFRSFCEIEVEPDGLTFDPETIRIEENRDTQAYGGYRIKMLGRLGRTEIPVQIDIGLGDAVTPEAETITLHTLLGMPEPVLKSYPRVTFVAEKLHPMVVLGIVSGRVQDHYDIWILARESTFDGNLLSQAIRNTFDRRKTPIPFGLPSGLSDEYVEDHEDLWAGFLKRSDLEGSGLQLKQVVDLLKIFLIPPMDAAARGEKFDHDWINGKWQTPEQSNSTAR
jgi:predicted nucleotidyltransferase component of viral defense system